MKNNLYSIKLVDVYFGNVFSAKEEKLKGVSGVIIKAGQGGYFSLPLDFIKQCNDVGLPYGVYWVIDSRYDHQKHVDEIKKRFSNKNFGRLGFWWDLEKPIWTMSDTEYHKTPYSGNSLIENITDDFYEWCGETGGMYTSPGFAKLLGWNTDSFKLSSLAEKLSKMPLWVAQYNNTITKPDLFGKWNDWVLWQYTAEPDYNYFNGTEEDFVKRFNLKEIPSVVIPDKDSKIEEKTLFDGIEYKKFESYPPSGQGRTLYHVVELDSEKVEFFVSPQLSSRMYVPQYLKKFNLDVAINGDGFLSTTIAGYGVSEGKPYGKKGVEQTLYVNKNNVFTQTPQSPAWNAISYPNLLVQNGKIVKINKTRDDIRGRSALGFTKDQKKVFLLAVDGKDYWSKDGMNFWEVAQVMLDLGCDFAIMLDGGGSTTLSAMQNGEPKLLNVPCGEDSVSGYEYPLRRVANVFGVRAKNKSVILPEKPDDKEELAVLSPISITTKNKGGRVKYKVLQNVKSRKTPSMFQTSTKSISAGFQFLSEETTSVTENISGLMVEIKWAKMEDGYWIPFMYKGVQYIEEVGEVEIPIENSSGAINVNVGIDESGKLYITVTDPNKLDVAKVLINGKEYKV